MNNKNVSITKITCPDDSYYYLLSNSGKYNLHNRGSVLGGNRKIMDMWNIKFPTKDSHNQSTGNLSRYHWDIINDSDIDAADACNKIKLLIDSHIKDPKCINSGKYIKCYNPECNNMIPDDQGNQFCCLYCSKVYNVEINSIYSRIGDSCSICNHHEYDGFKLLDHIKDTHKLSYKRYYWKFFVKSDINSEPTCPWCKSELEEWQVFGFRTYCSQSCQVSHKNSINWQDPDYYARQSERLSKMPHHWNRTSKSEDYLVSLNLPYVRRPTEYPRYEQEDGSIHTFEVDFQIQEGYGNNANADWRYIEFKGEQFLDPDSKCAEWNSAILKHEQCKDIVGFVPDGLSYVFIWYIHESNIKQLIPDPKILADIMYDIWENNTTLYNDLVQNFEEYSDDNLSNLDKYILDNYERVNNGQ